MGGLGPAPGHAPSCGVHALPSELDQAPGGTRFAWPQPTRRKVAASAPTLPPPLLWPYLPWLPVPATTGPLHVQRLLGCLPGHLPWSPLCSADPGCHVNLCLRLPSWAAGRVRTVHPPAACLLLPFLQIAYTGLPGTAVQTNEVTHSEWGQVALTSKLCRPLLELDLEYLVHLEVPVFLVKSA